MTFIEILTSIELGLIYSIVALGIYLTFKVINFQDLTCDGSFVLGAVSSTMMILAGYNYWIALSVAVIAGSCAGLFTGIISLYGKVPELLSGIIVSFMLYSINCAIMNGVPNRSVTYTATLFYAYAPIVIVTLLVGIIVAVISYILLSEWGLALRAVGLNKRLSSLMGINTNYMTLSGLMMSNGLIAGAGALLSQYQGFADVNQGTGTLIVGLAAVIIGSSIVRFTGVISTVIACAAGAILYRIIIGCALHSTFLGLPSYMLNMITGALLLIILIAKGATDVKA